MEIRKTYRRLGALSLLGLLVLAAGCGGNADGPGSTQTGLNFLVGERLGTQIAQDVGSDGQVVLLHLSMTEGGEVDQWMKGLEKGLDGAKVVEWGPEQLPAEARGVMGGYPPLRHALDQFPDAAAIVTALPVGAFEKPRFPADHPPIYALGWSYLPDSIFLFKSKHLAAGIFESPELVANRLDPAQPAEVLFDRNYVLVTPENLRKLVSQY